MKSTRRATRESPEAVARDFARNRRHKFSQEISSNPRDFKRQVLRAIRRELPPERGRPASPKIEAAIALLEQGKIVREVLKAQIEGFKQVDAYGRYLMGKAPRRIIHEALKHRQEGGVSAPPKEADALHFFSCLVNGPPSQAVHEARKRNGRQAVTARSRPRPPGVKGRYSFS